MKKTNIVFCGEGGQGIQTIAKIFSSASVRAGLEVAYMPSFGVEQRGTPSLASIVIAKEPLRYPQFEIADYVIVLNTRAIHTVSSFISPNTKVIFDSSTVSAKDLPKTSIHVFGIPATKYAAEKFNPKSFNMIVLGVISKIFEIPEQVIWEEVVNVLGKKFKDKQIEQQNHEAFTFGREAVFEKDKFTEAIYKTRHRSIIFKGYGKSGELVPNRCKGCGICIEKCPVGALSFGTDLGVFSTPVPTVDLEKCIGCGTCRLFCPDGAMSVSKLPQESS